MAIWRALLLVTLLAVRLQHGGCLDEMKPKTATQAPRLDMSSQILQPHNDDQCDNTNYTVSCKPGSTDAMAVVYFNTAVSCIFFIVSLIRVLGLEYDSRKESDTQFWWYLCCGCGGYILWMAYFKHCYKYTGAAVFPIFLVSILGGIIHFLLVVIATYLTYGTRDKRGFALVGILSSFIITTAILWVNDANWIIGWVGFSLTALSHCFRLGATNYQDQFKFWFLDVLIPIWTVNAFISAVGAVSGFLWLKHPQLCITMQYKVTSYVIGVIRGVEAYGVPVAWSGCGQRCWKARPIMMFRLRVI